MPTIDDALRVWPVFYRYSVEHGELLLQLGCELGQDYGIARPMPADAILSWAANWRTYPSWANLSAVSRNDFSLAICQCRTPDMDLGDRELYCKYRSVSAAEAIHRCRFTHWLDKHRDVFDAGRSEFEAIDILHTQTHLLAEELRQLKADNQDETAFSKIDELHDVCNSLLEQINLFIEMKSA